MYWIYVYIHTKYIKRRDLFKLLYAQQELFHEHLVILQYLESDTMQGWWPLIASKVDAARKEHLLTYFGDPDVGVIPKNYNTKSNFLHKMRGKHVTNGKLNIQRNLKPM